MSNGIGLCLSGGGFRASFYHIGLLAQMAEKGLLKQVEIISTVSGGSILGVAYYILLKRLLESKSDTDITDQDYVDLVLELEKSFKQGVAENIRMRTFLNPIANMRMARKNFSRSDQIGRLYTEFLYLPIYNKDKKPPEKVTSLNMTDLHIDPKGIQDFHPFKGKLTNQTRINKVPILVLNSTSLNSGHDWIFTGSGMGEIPPRNDIFYDIDKKDRYLYTTYKEIKTRSKGFPVGAAVAASAGVPGLFPPMAVSNLYLDKTVELVDGGVFDNQGIAGALWMLEASKSCDFFVVSDASGQGEATDNLDTGTLSVLPLMAGILTSRVREEMVNNLIKQSKSNVAFTHLTRGLYANKVLVNKKGEVSDIDEDIKHGVVDSKTAFNVAQNNQLLLSKIRTDLDAFSDYEVYSLEKDAYQMSDKRLQELKDNIDKKLERSSAIEVTTKWEFDCLKQRLGNKDDKALEKQLTIGQHKFFKTFRQNFVLSLVAHIPLIIFFLAVAFGIHYLVKTNFETPWEEFMKLNVLDLWGFFVGFIVVYALSWLGDRIVGEKVTLLVTLLRMPYKIINVFVVNVILPFLVAIPIWIFLNTINPLFLKLGRVEE